MSLGLLTLRSLFEARYYEDLDGGISEGLGRLFRQQLSLFIYPCKNQDPSAIEHLDSVRLDAPLQHLFTYLRERGCLVPLQDVAYQHLDNHSPRVLSMIAAGDESWTTLVPDAVAKKIVAGRLFGHDDLALA